MLSSACEPRICPIGAASGGHPDSARILDRLGERVEQAVAGGMGPEVDVERRDETCRQVVLGGPNGEFLGATGGRPSARSHVGSRLIVASIANTRRPRPVRVGASTS